MPLTRAALTLRDNFFYSNLELLLCYGTWTTNPTDSEIANSVVTNIGSPVEQTIVWNGSSNDISLRFIVTSSAKINRLVLKRLDQYVATFVLPIEQTIIPGTELEIDGQTFSS